VAPANSVLVLTVGEHEAGQRLDQMLKRTSDWSNRELAQLFASKQVRVDGHPAKKGERLAVGARIELPAPTAQRVIPQPELTLRLLLETEHLLVVDKPAGQACHVLVRDELDSLSNALVACYPELPGIGYSWREPGLIHRLDTFTSGVMIVARTESAFERLSRALTAGNITKQYLAIVEAQRVPKRLPHDIVLALEPDPGDKRRVRPIEGSAGLVTRVARQVEQCGPWALLELQVQRAYRHQIRAHLASINCPLLGDPLYGGAQLGSFQRGAHWRHALHASYAAWAGDDDFAGFTARSELAADLRAFLDAEIP